MRENTITKSLIPSLCTVRENTILRQGVQFLHIVQCYHRLKKYLHNNISVDILVSVICSLEFLPWSSNLNNLLPHLFIPNFEPNQLAAVSPIPMDNTPLSSSSSYPGCTGTNISGQASPTYRYIGVIAKLPTSWNKSSTLAVKERDKRGSIEHTRNEHANFEHHSDTHATKCEVLNWIMPSCFKLYKWNYIMNRMYNSTFMYSA